MSETTDTMKDVSHTRTDAVDPQPMWERGTDTNND